MLGAFKTSPIAAIKVKACLSPSSVRLDKVCANYALRVILLPKQNSIKQTLPYDLSTKEITLANICWNYSAQFANWNSNE
jgi:hypothetical protein